MCQRHGALFPTAVLTSADAAPAEPAGAAGAAAFPASDAPAEPAAAFPAAVADAADAAATRTTTSVANNENQPPAVTCPILPATIFGAAMDFLCYNEVRTALLAGKTIAHDAVKHTQTLNICNPYELNVRASRRFGNVREVNILCLIAFEHDDQNAHSLVTDAAARSVPFLLSFPKLDTAFLGGIQKLIVEELDTDTREYGIKCGYDPFRCVAPDNHGEIFRSLMMSLCGAFGSKSLPQSLNLQGILLGHRVCRSRNRRPDCSFCRHCCQSLPIRKVVMHYYWSILGSSATAELECLSGRDVLEIIQSRREGRQFLQSDTMFLKKYFRTMKYQRLDFTSSPFLRRIPSITTSEEELETYFNRMKRLNATNSHVVVYAPVESLQLLLEFGFKPKNLAREEMERFVRARRRPSYKKSGLLWPRREILAKASFDRLVAAGFAIEEDDFIVVDAANEPVLAGIESLMR